jgi:hypothetical protein
LLLPIAQHGNYVSYHPVNSLAKVEPFKQWLARVGYERLEEIENPELSMERMQALYCRPPGFNRRMEKSRRQDQLGIRDTDQRDHAAAI